MVICQTNQYHVMDMNKWDLPISVCMILENIILSGKSKNLNMWYCLQKNIKHSKRSFFSWYKSVVR